MKKTITSIGAFLFGSFLVAQNAEMISNINTKSAEYDAEDFCELNNKLYFSANTNQYGRELYVYDPSLPFPQQVSLVEASPFEDINYGNPSFLTKFNGSIYMNYNDSVHGSELFSYNGTGSPQLVSDLESQTGSSMPKNLTVYKNKLYFTAEVNGNRELYAFDGTNTAPVTTFASASNVFNNSEFEVVNDTLYFTVQNTSAPELYVYDGVNAPAMVSVSLANLPSRLTAFNDLLYFSYDNGSSGEQLFKLDENKNIQLVRQFGSFGGYPNHLTVFNDTLFLVADDDNFDRFLYAVDTNDNTTTFSAYDSPNSLIVSNNKLYFHASQSPSRGVFEYTNQSFSLIYDETINDISLTCAGKFFEFQNQLYSKCGTFTNAPVSKGVIRFEPNFDATYLEAFDYIDLINDGSIASLPSDEYIAYNGAWYFVGVDNTNTKNLYKATTDTVIQLTNTSTSGSSNIKSLTVFNGELYFSYSQSTNHGIYKYDGTQITLVQTTTGIATDMVDYKNELYFTYQFNSSTGQEICKLDGGNNILLVSDYEPGSASGGMMHPIVFNDTLFFEKKFGTNNDRWHYFDGTNLGQITGNNYYGIGEGIEFNNKIYFVGSVNPFNGTLFQLWSFENSASQPTLVTPNVEDVGKLRVSNNKLHFLGKSLTNGVHHAYTLTTAGQLDSVALPGFTNPGWLSVINDQVFFVGNGNAGKEIYKVEANGTVLLTDDIAAGVVSSDPNFLTVINDTIFFGASDLINGREPFYMVACSLDNSITNNSSTLSANLSGASYQWVDCGTNQPISGETGQSFTPSVTGDYAVEIDNGSCTLTSACEFVSVNTTTIADQKIDEIVLYPNPTSGLIRIKGAFDNYVLYNTLGQPVMNGTENNMDLSFLEKGTYLLRINNNKSIQTKTIIKL